MLAHALNFQRNTDNCGQCCAAIDCIFLGGGICRECTSVYLNYLIEVQGTTKAQMHSDRHFKKSNFDKSTEMKSLEANEKFTLSKNAVAAALIFFFFFTFQKMSLAAVQSLRQFSTSFDKQTSLKKSCRNYVCSN